MKALFIASHCDDELCFAGAMQNFESSYLSFSNCNNGELHKECLKSLGILKAEQFEIKDFPVRKFRKNRQKIADRLFSVGDDFGDFDIVFSHSWLDRHPDHRTVGEESRRVFNGGLVTYVGPWNGNENPNYFVELSEQQLEKKITALACYKSQQHRPYMDAEFIRSWAIYNGIKCGKRYAEAFRIEKLIN